MTIADLTVQAQEEQVLDEDAAEKLSSRRLLSSFGTAREAILSILRIMDESEWDQERETEEGPMTVTQVVDELIESDKVLAKKVLDAAKAKT
ncbi:MAG: hypothetical protein ACOC9Y_08005 [Chloroflexota bacterium]